MNRENSTAIILHMARIKTDESLMIKGIQRDENDSAQVMEFYGTAFRLAILNYAFDGLEVKIDKKEVYSNVKHNLDNFIKDTLREMRNA